MIHQVVVMLNEMTGLEFMQAVIDGEVPYKGITQAIDMKFSKISDGYAEVEGCYDHSVDNFMGTVHGGVFATILDTAMGNAVVSKLNKGESFGTVELDIKLIRPIPHHQKMIACGEVKSMTSRLAVVEGNLKDEAGKLYATGSCLCMIHRQ